MPCHATPRDARQCNFLPTKIIAHRKQQMQGGANWMLPEPRERIQEEGGMIYTNSAPNGYNPQAVRQPHTKGRRRKSVASREFAHATAVNEELLDVFFQIVPSSFGHVFKAKAGTTHVD